MNHAELRQAVRDLQNRGLLHSARWAAEQLYGLADEVPVAAHDATPTQLRDDDDDEMEMETPARGFEEESLWRGRGGTAETAGDDYVLAKAYFDLGEYRRASHQLSENRTSLGRFLRYYALYLAGEKRKNEEMLEVGGSALGGHVPGPGGAGASGAGGAPPAGAGAKDPALGATSSTQSSRPSRSTSPSSSRMIPRRARRPATILSCTTSTAWFSSSEIRRRRRGTRSAPRAEGIRATGARGRRSCPSAPPWTR